MSKKALELETRNIMQGLEEFATFMSFNSDLTDMRILSVESIEHDHSQQRDIQPKAEVIALPINRTKAKNTTNQQLYKSLSL